MKIQKRNYMAAFALAAIVAVPLAAQAQSSAQGGMGIKVGFSCGDVPSNGGALPGKLSAQNGACVGVGINSGGALSFGIEGM